MLRETVQHCCTQTVYFKQLINNISFFSYPKLNIKKHFFQFSYSYKRRTKPS